jgi:hypothetical protein
MATTFEARHIQIRALHDHVIVSDMDFGEIRLSSGIILRSDDGKSHGIKPRWGKVYKVGPEQKDIKEGQWILVEHGRWTRKIKINDGDSEKEIQKVDTEAILAVSDEKPNDSDQYIGDSV